MVSAGMLGRLPVLFSQVKLLQLAPQVTLKTWPGCEGVFWSKPPTAAYPIGVVVVLNTVGSSTTSRMGRLGSMALPPVRFFHVEVTPCPAPRPKPIQTLPSLVPAI